MVGVYAGPAWKTRVNLDERFQVPINNFAVQEVLYINDSPIVQQGQQNS